MFAPGINISLPVTRLGIIQLKITANYSRRISPSRVQPPVISSVCCWSASGWRLKSGDGQLVDDHFFVFQSVSPDPVNHPQMTFLNGSPLLFVGTAMPGALHRRHNIAWVIIRCRIASRNCISRQMSLPLAAKDEAGDVAVKLFDILARFA